MVNMMITAQIQLEADKAEKAEKNFRQEIQALQLELGAEKLKSKDLEDRLTQAQEFAGIFKKKFTELSATVQATECENSANS